MPRSFPFPVLSLFQLSICFAISVFISSKWKDVVSARASPSLHRQLRPGTRRRLLSLLADERITSGTGERPNSFDPKMFPSNVFVGFRKSDHVLDPPEPSPSGSTSDTKTSRRSYDHKVAATILILIVQKLGYLNCTLNCTI